MIESLWDLFGLAFSISDLYKKLTVKLFQADSLILRPFHVVSFFIRRKIL